MLISHGAIDDLARSEYITATRKHKDTPSKNIKERIFRKSFHSRNRFTLSGFMHIAISCTWKTGITPNNNPFKFPDLTSITITRRKDGKESSETINFLDHLRPDSAKPIWLEWGDIIEIPERAHPVSESWRNMDKLIWIRLNEKLHRHVKFQINGMTHEFALMPSIKEPNDYMGYVNSHEMVALRKNLNLSEDFSTRGQLKRLIEARRQSSKDDPKSPASPAKIFILRGF